MLRPNTLTEMGLGLGEPEMDANSALTELDKGLRSPKLGEQCEAIVRFPNLFEKYPFPILINSAFLKLADVFRTSTNFLRIWVLRVCQQSERHLDKIINVDEFVRRIFSVIHSNDPIARALTLRTLGSLSGLIPERKHVHHSIRVSLDSSDTVEVSAAIYAATCFAKRSKTFANTMCTKISSMIKRISTPNDLKLRLIPIFKYMHHDVTVAATVHNFCQEILEHYPSKEFVITTLHTMTELAAATLSNLKEQVTFLVSYLDDPRLIVKLCVLEDLKYLGKKGGHLWEANDISTLIKSVQKYKGSEGESESMETDETPGNGRESEEKKIVSGSLDVIKSLTTSSALLNCLYLPDSVLKSFLRSCIESSERDVALKTINITTSIAVNWKNETLLNSSINLMEMTVTGLDAVLKDLSSCANKPVTQEDIKRREGDWERCLSYGVLLCKATPSKCSWFCTVIINLLKHGRFPAKTRNLISQAIGAIGDFRPEAVQNILPDIFQFLENLDPEQIQAENNTVVCLAAVILQSHQKYVMSERAVSILSKILDSSNCWDRYRIARSSFRYGQPALASKALEGLSSNVSSENFYYWMSALYNIARAEETVADSRAVPNLQTRLNQSCTLYLQAVMALRAASSPSVSMQFQIEYMRIRSEMFVAFMNFLSACGTLQFSPPPAIAPTIAAVSRDDLLKSGRVVTQLRKSIRDFQTVSELYGRLYQTAFDADNDTLMNLTILQQLCLIVARGIETLVFSKDHPSVTHQDQFFTFNEESSSSTLHLLIQSCKEAMKILKNLKNSPVTAVTHQHLETIKEAVRLLVETPLPYPRFFFQNLQTTRVKIAVSPQPRTPGENVSVILGNNLALKVEGVIHQTTTGSKGSSKGIYSDYECSKGFRRPKAIRMTVVSTPVQSARTHLIDSKQMTAEPSTIVKDVFPHKDFFTAQFLLGSWSSGLYTVTVDTALIDYDGRVWLTGPRATLGIRVLSEVQQNPPLMSSENKPGTPTGMPPAMARPGPSGTPSHMVPAGSVPRY